MITSPLMNSFLGRKAKNLYLSFIDLSFRHMSEHGFAGLIHQDGHLTDNNGQHFRTKWYRRICKHFEFTNVLSSKNFSEVSQTRRFSLNVYRGQPSDVEFINFVDAYLPSQIEESFCHDGSGKIPGLRDSDGKIDVRGHANRVVVVDNSTLEQIARLSEVDFSSHLKANYLAPISLDFVDIFSHLGKHPTFGFIAAGSIMSGFPLQETTNLLLLNGAVELPPSPNKPVWHSTGFWSDASGQKTGCICKRTEFRKLTHSILSGPHIYVGNPYYQTPNRLYNSPSDYEHIDMFNVSSTYVPRSNFGPACDFTKIDDDLPVCPWDSKTKISDLYRVALRKMISMSGERSLIATLIPPDVLHVDSLESIAFRDQALTLLLHAFLLSLPADCLVKILKKDNFRGADAVRLPCPPISQTAVHRGLRLTSLTAPYADIWDRYAPSLSCAPWSSTDNRLRIDGPVAGTKHWDWTTALRTDFARRLALIEVDVLVAQSLDMTLEQLLEMYRIYFPVLQQNEANTYFDQQGRIVWTRPGSLANVGYLEPDKAGTPKRPSLSRWREILESKQEELTCIAYDDTLPDPNNRYANAESPREIKRRFVGPFTQCNRVDDYKRAWAHFDRLRADGVEV